VKNKINKYMEPEKKISRRQLIGVSAGLAAAAITPTILAQANPHNTMEDSEVLVDPTTKYPKPPF